MINFNCNKKLYATVKVFTYIIEEPNRLLLRIRYIKIKIHIFFRLKTHVFDYVDNSIMHYRSDLSL